MFDIVIIDDEPLACDRLQRLVAELGQYEVTAVAYNAEQGLIMIETYDPAIVLLDIEMPGISGLDLAKTITAMDCPPAVIFTTAYDEYALEAFSTVAVGYLLKPVSKEQLQQSLDKAQIVNKVQLENIPTEGELNPSQGTGEDRKYIKVSGHRGIDLIPVDDIRCFLADKKYVTIITADNEYLMDSTLKQIEEDFEQRFLRVHRNALVSVPHVEGLERTREGQYTVRLSDCEHHPVVSRRYTSRVKAFLKNL